MPAPRLVRPPLGTLESRDDDELMTLVQAGSRAALEALIDRYAERLVRACARFVGDHDLGAELAQDTWLAVWSERARYRPRGRFVVWLLTLARNRCRNNRRHRAVSRAHAEREAAWAGETPAPDQIDDLLVRERRRRVREAIARLPAGMQEALMLRYGEDLPYDEMSAVLSVGESTLRSRVHHGLRLLRNILEGES